MAAAKLGDPELWHPVIPSDATNADEIFLMHLKNFFFLPLTGPRPPERQSNDFHFVGLNIFGQPFSVRSNNLTYCQQIRTRLHTN